MIPEGSIIFAKMQEVKEEEEIKLIEKEFDTNDKGLATFIWLATFLVVPHL